MPDLRLEGCIEASHLVGAGRLVGGSAQLSPAGFASSTSGWPLDCALVYADGLQAPLQ